MKLRSPGFEDGGEIPDRYGFQEENVNPPLRIANVPEDAVSLVLIVDDPDAKPVAGTVWDHWIVYDIPPETEHIEENSSPGTAGRNDYGDIGYGGPNPPDRPHTYIFTLYAVGDEVGLAQGASREDVEQEIEEEIIETTVLKGSYSP